MLRPTGPPSYFSMMVRSRQQVQLVEAVGVDLEQREGGLGGGAVDAA